MKILSVVFGANDTTFQLCFKSEESLGRAFPEAPTTQHIAITDDYGSTVVIRAGQLRGHMVRDTELSQEAEIEGALHNARTNAKANRLAQTDSQITGGGLITPPANGHLLRQ